MYTIINSDDYDACGIKTMTFPGGEPHVKLPTFSGRVLFVARCRTWMDTTYAALVANALDQQLGRGNIKRLEVFLPYLPAARQDRAENGHAALTLKIVGNMFDGPGTLAARTHVFDAHSDSAMRYVNSANWFWDALAPAYHPRIEFDGVISPDVGAYKRAERFFNRFFAKGSPYAYPQRHVCGAKVRDPETGALSRYKVEQLPCAGHWVVIDDICDGGGTFNLLMDELLLTDDNGNARASTFELVVSHGIFSRGLNALHERYERITTTDSWCRGADDASAIIPGRLTVVPLAQLYDKIMGEC